MLPDRCPSCLKPGKGGFCKKCTRELFGGIKVSPFTDLDSEVLTSELIHNPGRMSISGVQTKYQARLEAGSLVAIDHGGEYILKPVPVGRFKHLDQAPANEHITMQIARQIYRIETASNGIVLLDDFTPVYITKRFDRSGEGYKLLMEDMAQISGSSEDKNGLNYKYDSSYEEVAELIKSNCISFKIQIEKFFNLVVFNYLFSNGDAHLKNFSLIQDESSGGRVLAPAYDLLNTGIHIPGESDMALELFKDEYMTESYRAGSKHTEEDFLVFATRCGISEKRAIQLYQGFLSSQENVIDLVKRSFLSEEVKALYINSYLNRFDRLKSQVS